MSKRQINNRFNNNKNKKTYRSNEEIRANVVRVTGEGIESGVYPLSEALEMAENLDLDLVEIVPKADPPVCKVVNLEKFLYQQKKLEREQAKKQRESQVEVKEIRFGPNTEEHDFEFKKRNAQKFLEKGDKVKAWVHFKGRTIMFKDRGEILLLRLAQDLEDIAKVESMPKMEGRKMIMFLAPSKSKKK